MEYVNDFKRSIDNVYFFLEFAEKNLNFFI